MALKLKDIKKLTNKQLAQDWTLICERFSLMKDGEKTEFETMDELVSVAKDIFNEIDKREDISLKPENFKKHYTKELYEMIVAVKSGGVDLRAAFEYAGFDFNKVTKVFHDTVVDKPGNGNIIINNNFPGTDGKENAGNQLKPFDVIKSEIKTIEKSDLKDRFDFSKGVWVEPKYNSSLHIHKDAYKHGVMLNNILHDESDILPELSKDIKSINSDVILKSIVTYIDHDGFITDNDKMRPIFKVVDIIYKDEPITETFTKRQEILDQIFKDNEFSMLQRGLVKKADTQEKFNELVNEMCHQEGSTGAIINGEFEVLNKTEMVLRCEEDGRFSYKLSKDKMGMTEIMTDLDIKKGEYGRIVCHAISPVNFGERVGIKLGGGKVIEKVNSGYDSAKDIIKRAEKDSTLQLTSEHRVKLKGFKLIKQLGSLAINEGDSGVLIVQHHERGLSEDQAKYTEYLGQPVKLKKSDFHILNKIKKGDWKQLITEARDNNIENLRKFVAGIDRSKLSTNQRKIFAKVDPVSIHTDFRLQVTKPVIWDYWMGWESLTPTNQYQVNKLANMDTSSKIHLDFKKSRNGEGDESHIRGPLKWMETETKVIKSGDVGATTKNMGRITTIEKLNFKAGKQGPDFKEFVFDGQVINGRWILDKTGVNKNWVMTRPKKDNYQATDFKKEISIIKGDKNKRIIYGIVYEPNVVDAHGDSITPEALLEAAHGFLEKHNSINFMHDTRINQDAKVVESFIAPITYKVNGETIRKGSWVMALHILDEKLWGMIMKGVINAFSIEGTAKAG